ncbi:MAG TPA: S9 family peptidase [Candidatus Limiplasma sp.]|nr:S9 family peptidase [Candidatus Limiplasma sp.]HRX07853.1 S9 family peptidase [Candidatus Limiplasma sp.]
MLKAFSPETMANIAYLSEPAASPDGSAFAFVKANADAALDGFASSIYIHRRRVSEPVKLEGDGVQRSPSWSPDGKSFAYLTDASGEFQIWIQDLKSGAHRQLTTLRHGVERYVWAPDSGSIAFECKVYPAEVADRSTYAEMSADEKAHWLAQQAQAPVEITELIYKYDDEGILDGSRRAIGIVNLNSGNVRFLSTDIPSFLPAWSADSSKLAFYGWPYTGARARKAELFVCRADGSRRSQLTSDLLIGAESPPCFARDGEAIIIDVYPELPDGGMVQSLYSVPLDGGKPYELFDRSAANYMGINGCPASRTIYGKSSPLFTLSSDGKKVYYLLASHGGTGVFRLHLGSRKTEPVLYGNFSVQAFCLTREDTVLYTRGEPGMIAELFYGNQRITHSNPWLDAFQLGSVQKLSVPTRDGEASIQGWVMPPAFRKEGVKYPAVLEIRGGPETTSTADFWHEYQALAGAGFAVLYCNPRGSAGYGPAFMQKDAAWDKAADDLLDFVSAAVALGFIDETRIGVTGGSYGGYMTNKLICTTDVFAAAVEQRTLCNLCTSYGTGDIGFVSSRSPMPDDFKMLAYLTDRAKRSLICQIDEIKVPVLLLHGYADYRCSFEQAEQFFVAMKERHPKIPSRLVMFPDESHEITRTGKPANQIRHLSELVNWFCKYLIDEPWQGVACDA